MQEIVNAVIKSVVGALLAIAVPVLTGYAAKAIRKWNRRQDKSEVEAAAKTAVKWAAQKMQDSLGKERYWAVADRIASKLPWVDEEDLEQAIEAAVHDLNAAAQ